MTPEYRQPPIRRKANRDHRSACVACCSPLAFALIDAHAHDFHLRGDPHHRHDLCRVCHHCYDCNLFSTDEVDDWARQFDRGTRNMDPTTFQNWLVREMKAGRRRVDPRDFWLKNGAAKAAESRRRKLFGDGPDGLG